MLKLINNNILFNKYQIIKEIGSGGMASVYSAIELASQTPVALKIINNNLATDNEYVKRFHREAELIAGLKHPNIISIFEHGEINGIHYIAMELLQGVPLSTHIKNNKRLSLDETISIILPILDALNHAHEKGIIHRDIKSSNIFITQERRPVLLDFGIAHFNSGTQLTKAGAIFGTPEYMSPEQAKGEKVDHRTDIYSIGMVMYECLTGTLPFSGTNPITVIHKIIYEKPISLQALRTDLPPAICQIVEKAIAYSPKQRFNHAVDFINALKFYSVSGSLRASKIRFPAENYFKNAGNGLKNSVFAFTMLALVLGFIESITIQNEFTGNRFLGVVIIALIPAIIGNSSIFLILKMKSIDLFYISLLSSIVFLILFFIFALVISIRINTIFALIFPCLFVAGMAFSSISMVHAFEIKQLKIILINIILLIIIISFFMLSLKNILSGANF